MPTPDAECGETGNLSLIEIWGCLAPVLNGARGSGDPWVRTAGTEERGGGEGDASKLEVSEGQA